MVDEQLKKNEAAKPEDAEAMCKCIRETVAHLYDEETAECVTVLYGGSVKPQNIAELMEMPDIDGALVGGASLTPESFYEIVNLTTKCSKTLANTQLS